MRERSLQLGDGRVSQVWVRGGQVLRRIRMNYVWALGYNVLMLPLAAGALFPLTHLQLPPWLAGGAMAFSSVSVVCSSLLLRLYRRPPPVLRDVTLAVQ